LLYGVHGKVLLPSIKIGAKNLSIYDPVDQDKGCIGDQSTANSIGSTY
jgi:hypothetical protein